MQRTQQQSRPKINAPSISLTPEENDAVFKLLGRKCQSLNTAVVQIYKTEGSAHSHWKKKHTGVLCFVKDSAIRSYFLRAYCLIENELIWEHEVYDAMKVIKSRSFLLTFEGQDGHVGLNFVSEEECDDFYKSLTATIETRNRKRLEKRNRPKSTNAPNSKINTITLSPTPAPTFKANPLTTVFGLTSAWGKDKKRKFNKTDISKPTNCIHISHVGWNQERGFDLKTDNDEMLKEFLQKVGVSENQMKDPDTLDFIYEFIQSNKVLESTKSETVEKPIKSTAPAPPPVPSRQYHATQNGSVSTHRSAPPPPPPPPIPTTVPGSAGPPLPPLRPPPISAVETSQSSVNSSAAVGACGNDARTNLLESIRSGVELRPVEPREKRPIRRSGEGDATDALADALRKALQDRFGKITGNSSEEELSENDDDWEECI